MPKKRAASRPRQTWREKLEKDVEKVVTIPPKMQKAYGKGKMLIPQPLKVDALIRKVRKGKLVTYNQLREKLAKDAGVGTACPICTGIFTRIAAEVSEEDRKVGKKQITPYWRVLKEGGKLNEKFPGGVKAQARRLIKEGHIIISGAGKQPPCVGDFEQSLQKL